MTFFAGTRRECQNLNHLMVQIAITQKWHYIPELPLDGNLLTSTLKTFAGLCDITVEKSQIECLQIACSEDDCSSLVCVKFSREQVVTIQSQCTIEKFTFNSPGQHLIFFLTVMPLQQ
jgi:hypothetical protein